MKRILTLLLTISMLLSLAACGGTPAQSAPTSTGETSLTSPGDGPKLITNVNDFLAAIGPDTEILLAEGTFLLNTATDYGNSSSPYYTWESLGGGDFSLAIQDVSGLTIRGCGQGKTSLLAEPRASTVLTLNSCTNVTLESMSLGHTVQANPCEGSVLRLSAAANITAKDLDLYGCGTIGIDASHCQGLKVQDCTIHDCSMEGLYLDNSKDVTIQSSTFRSLGKEDPVSGVFYISGCDAVTVSNCVISNNYVRDMLFGNSNEGTVTFQDNQFSENRVSQAVFSFYGESLVLDGNVFEDTECRNWYATGSSHAVDLEGHEIIFEGTPDPADPASVTPGVAAPVSTGDQKQVHVSTADEFLAALDNDTCIILDSELIDLSTASDYAKAEEATKNANTTDNVYKGTTDNYYWENHFDGPSLVISGLSNLTIQSEDTDRTTHVISATPRYAHVLTFENCAAITIANLTAGHTKEPGSCMGGVVSFRSCENLLVDNCGLFGCGVIGVMADYSRNLQVINSEIYECSQSGIRLTCSENVTIAGTLIRDIGNEYTGDGPFFDFVESANITLDGQPMDGYYQGR